MTVELESALRRKCEADERLRLLQAQWEYDQRLVARSLQAVGAVFPHYSLHDASHSNTILVQITRVLGAERIERLSATDVWLLLESAYWHDVGMVVDDETLRRWWTSEAFLDHLEKLRSSSDDPMLTAAAELLARRDRDATEGDTWPLDVKRALTLVTADFARAQHAARSGSVVSHPLTIGIESPRTTLIPARLFEWLSKIVSSHGQRREQVMTLPYQESGLGTDVCHPRFIAFMLRLGDLLDLDNGRFCATLAATFGNLPPTSLAHVGKHASIRRFQVSPAKIAVEAVCRRTDANSDPYGAYEAVASWLDWLRQEIQFLASTWSDIAPANFGGAPSLGSIKAEIEGYISVEEGQRPRFRVDESAFLGLVRGTNLYKERHAWLRELVANAEDATRIRLFMESRAKHPEQRGHAPAATPANEAVEDAFKEFREAFDAHPVEILLDQPEHGGARVSTNVPGNTVSMPKGGAEDRCSIVIRDQGTGISLADLHYILTIGSSSKNPERRRLIRQMPAHLEPTGSFGIGLQSVFMVTNEVTIRSMHFRTGDRLHIVIRRPPANGERLSLAKRLNDSFAERPAGAYVRTLGSDEGPHEPGTIISFDYAPYKGVEDAEYRRRT